MKNEKLYNDAVKRLVGGVNSPIRATISPYPFFTDHAKGAYLWDVEGNRYCDYCLAYGPIILGHSEPAIVKAIRDQAEKGAVYGTPTPLEVRYAEKFCELAPNVEMIRTVNSGTEATMAALRLARAVTGRSTIAMLNGGYHGSHDGVLTKREDQCVVASSRGVTENQVRGTRMVGFNDAESLEDALKREDVAAFIVEPVMGNVGCVVPNDGYLNDARKICDETGTLFIIDETITGFRLSVGGAQEYYGVDADIVTYGKIAGGGLPIGVIGSSREIMENFTPVGNVYNAGTFSGNPLSMAAGLAALETLNSGAVLDKIHSRAEQLVRGVRDMLPSDSCVKSAPAMFQIYFGCEDVRNADDARRADKGRFMQFWRKMLDSGYFLPPSHFETNFLSACHDDGIVDSTLEAIGDALK
ncbi:MAG TPA: glutamate-1-semialdehyde 2,1-aminomutase [Candidatus Methanofastidiosa archaeon]|nr:glutamate-1-semialdehyde 2,1-aminomutase [Candidatus Methanofastidiosa archaeon]